MIRPVPFLVLSLLLIGAVAFVATYVPDGDVFASPTRLAHTDLTRVPVGTVAELKLRRAVAEEPFDVALFGNSRSLAVGSEDLGVRSCRFHNFSLSGQSLRSSVEMVGQLAAADRLPRTVVVSFDNLSLQFIGNPDWLALPERWAATGRDLSALWRREDVALTDWLRMGWRHARSEATIFRSLFEPRFLKTGASMLFAPPTTVSDGRAYRTDGSLPYVWPGPGVEPFDVPAPQIIAGYLRADLERLARTTRDSRAVIYESPLEPVVARQLATHPTSYVEQHRRTFLAACRESGLICLAAPLDFAAGQAWWDASHPPAAALGAFIRERVLELEPACADDL